MKTFGSREKKIEVASFYRGYSYSIQLLVYLFDVQRSHEQYGGSRWHIS